MPTCTVDTVVIGGGVVGASLAYGLRRAGERVCLVDQGDVAFRAARGNFGLVWVQGKGAGCPPYARWTMAAATAWRAFATDLKQRTGVDVALSQPGGLTCCLNDEELEKRVHALTTLRRDVGKPYPFEILNAAQVRSYLPAAGADIAGAVRCPMDGHVSPLKLLRALIEAFQRSGGQVFTGTPVARIECLPGGGFLTHRADAPLASAKVVLAAGLGNRSLAPQVGLHAPVKPVRGQVLVTERMQPFLPYPTLHVRQTDEGTVQIGDSKEDVGFDDGTTMTELARIAARALRCFPPLANAKVVRTWGALRVMSPDGLPIYEASSQCPGAFLVTCHSGITLAPQHAGPVVEWMRGTAPPADMRAFTMERFHVQNS